MVDKMSIASDEEPRLCGIGAFRPKWMQIFASPKVFMIHFALLGIVQGRH